MAVQNSLTGKTTTDLATCSFNVFMTSDAVRNKINKMVGGKDGQRFITSIISAISTNPALAECENMSILSAAMLGESLKLSPSPQLGQYYMVPYNDKEWNPTTQRREVVRTIAQFQLGYKGYIQLAIRSGYYIKLNVLAIKEGELISYNPLDEEIKVALIEDDCSREDTPTIGYYAMFEYGNGFKKSMYWSFRKMRAHADRYSQAYNAEIHDKIINGDIPTKDMWKYSSFWYKDFDGMAYKTMLRQLISKWGVMSIEMQSAFEKDMGVILEDDKVEYVDNAKAPNQDPETQEIEDKNVTVQYEVEHQTVDITKDYVIQDDDPLA